MVQNTCCGDGKECIVTDVSSLADPCMASCDVFYRLPDGSIWLLNKEGDGYQEVFVANDLTKIDWNADPNADAGISNRPFKAIAWGLKLDDDGNLTVDKLILPTPDWNVTDPDSKDYIKNKPFETIGDHLYVEDGALNVCLEDHINLLPNSTWNLGVGTWTMNPINDNNFEILDPEDDKPTSHILHAKPIPAGVQQTSNLPHPIKVEAGNVMTIAFDYKENQIPDRNSTLFSLRVFPERDTGNSQENALWFQNISHSTVHPDWATTPILNFTRFTVTFTPQATGWLDPVVYDSDQSGTHESWFRELMVIEGEACEMPDEWYPFFGDQVQSDWNVTSMADPAYIKNKPSIPDPQIQSDWAQSNTSAVDFIKNKPTIPDPQIQSDWNQTSTTAKDFIKNKPTIPIPEPQVQSDWDVTDTNSKAFIKNKPVIPEGAVLYPSTGQNTNGAMTQKATTDELAKKANVTDLAGFVTINTDQTIESTKTWGEIITDGSGEHGQITTVSPDGTIHQLQKVAGSNQYSEVEIAYGRITVTRHQSDGTPIRSSLFTEDGESRSTDRMYTPVPMNATEWEANSARVKVRNGILVLHISGARPLATIDGKTGGNIKVVATLPPEFASHLTENVEFQWSNFGGGQAIYPGRLDTNGQVKLYIIPTANTIVVNNRFSIYLPIIL